MKKTLTLMLLMMISLASVSQDRKITGLLIDGDSKEPMSLTTVQLLKSDSTFVVGALTDDDGRFTLKAPKNGSYIVKCSYVGYVTMTKDVKINGKDDVDLGEMTIKPDAVMLKGTTVTAQASKMTIKKDTFVYNAAAYRTPEGSVIEELVKKLPGAEVDDEGNITINGKQVKQILIDGKEFMKGDTKTAMKNLPTSIINNIKSYDKKSDLARITGIEDGNEETVLDFGIKPGMNKGFLTNIDLAVGNHGLYAERVMAGMFKDKWRLMGFGNANNTGDRGFPGGGGGGFWGNSQGRSASKMAGLNFNYDDKDKLEIDASLRWNHGNTDVLSQQSTQMFVGTGSFGNSLSQRYGRTNSWNGRFRLEWRPDSMTNIIFRPQLTLSKTDSRGWSNSAQFSDDPYQFVTDPLDPESIKKLDDEDVAVNYRTNSSLSYSDNNSARTMFQFNRKLNNRGRNITLRGDFSYSDADSKNITANEVTLFKVMNAAGLDSTYYTNRYSVTPTKNYSYSAQATYSEPIADRTYLQFSYQYTYNYSKSDKTTYEFSLLPENIFGGLTPMYRDWNMYLSHIPVGTSLADYESQTLSRYSEYKNYIQEFNLMFRRIRDKYQLNAGVMFQPQRSKFTQDYLGIHTDTVRNVFNITPTVDYRYRPNDQTELRLTYRGSTSQPSMTQLLDIRDDSDPLNIVQGNPGLKPAFSNNLRLFYSTARQFHQQSLVVFGRYTNTRNSVVNRVNYNLSTGGTISTHENINGNWNADLVFVGNTAIDSAGVWNVNLFTRGAYNNIVGYLYQNDLHESIKNTTRTTSVMSNLRGSWRKSIVEVSLDASVNYNHSRNKLQSAVNLDTWQFAYGGSLNIFAPWGTSLSTDIHNQSRRGYNDKSMNTNELIWNAQISQSFLKGRPLTISLQFYDILNKQSNYSRSISDIMRSDTQYNTIHSYAMVHVIYRLNLFNGKSREGGMGGPGMGGPGGGRGGFGGGRGPGGGGFGGRR